MVECWGSAYEKPSFPNSYAPPEGEYVAVAVDEHFSCAVRSDSSLLCWGWGNADNAFLVGEGFTDVGIGDEAFCGLLGDGGVECWERGGAHSGGAPQRVKISEVTPEGKGFVSITVGTRHACGLRQDSTVECWGDNYDYELYCISGQFGMPRCGFERQGTYIGQAESPVGLFLAVSAGAMHTCGLRLNGMTECWGADSAVQSSPASERFTSISSGTSHTCGIRLDGSARCWDSGFIGYLAVINGIPEYRDQELYVLEPPDLPFVSISAGDGYSCGIVTGGQLKCWGKITR